MSTYTWVQIYVELADAVLVYRNRQPELVRMLKDIAGEEELPIFGLDDQFEGGKRDQLKNIDPFTFFAAFNRGTTKDVRREFLKQLKIRFALKSPVPEDFDGIPTANNMNSWFFGYAEFREDQDIGLLWDLAVAARKGPPATLPPALFEKCLNIYGIKAPKLTMGLFWINPAQYLALDSVMRDYLDTKGIELDADTVQNLDDYLAILKKVNAEVGSDYKVISYDAWKASAERIAQAAAAKSSKKYWAGGFLWGGENSKLEEFIDGNYWQIGWPKDDPNDAARKTWEAFAGINKGDEFAIKGFGGQNDLKIYYIGEVVSVDRDAGRLGLKRLERTLFKGKRPVGAGSGNWFSTLVPVTSPPVIDLLFNGKDNGVASAPVDELKPYTIEQALDGLFFERAEFEAILNMWRDKKNLILQGPPGVGKTFIADRLAYALLGQEDPDRVRMVQFHQSLSYEDFIQGWRPDGKGGFALKNGTFYEFCQKALQDEAAGRPYVFIIDEINRGNLSKILGEMMMLIESDKRKKKYALPLTYTKDPDDTFYVPSNIYIMGLMNTADRSLALVDYALRRRFRFQLLSPKFNSPMFRKYLEARGIGGELIGRIVGRMNDLNAAIESDRRNLGHGYQVGHSYFCPAGSGPYDDKWYEQVIRSEVVPLLEEYWFDQPDIVQAWSDRLLK